MSWLRSATSVDISRIEEKIRDLRSEGDEKSVGVARVTLVGRKCHEAMSGNVYITMR